MAFGLLFTVASRQLLSRTHVVLAAPVLTYQSLTALFTGSGSPFFESREYEFYQ